MLQNSRECQFWFSKIETNIDFFVWLLLFLIFLLLLLLLLLKNYLTRTQKNLLSLFLRQSFSLKLLFWPAVYFWQSSSEVLSHAYKAFKQAKIVPKVLVWCYIAAFCLLHFFFFSLHICNYSFNAKKIQKSITYQLPCSNYNVV